jgi:hypothetical protein
MEKSMTKSPINILVKRKKKLSIKRRKDTMISYRTCLSSISDFGYKLDILKSGIQKYLRRRELDKMIWCAMEIFKFELWSENEKEKKMCKGIITNMLNRIIVMMDEELLFCEIERYVVLREMIEKFDKDRKNGLKYLLNICKCLSEGRICRHASDIRAYWDYRYRFDGEKKLEDMQKKVDLKGNYIDDDDDFYYIEFIENFEGNWDEMYYWIFKIFNRGSKTKKYCFNKKKEYIYKIWKILFDLPIVKENDIIKKVLDYKYNEFDKKRGERFMFLVNCIELLRDNGNRVPDKEKSKKIYNSLINCYDINLIESSYVRKIYKYMEKSINIDDYVIDMHTSQGRKMGKNRKDFALEGCLVVNEEKEFLVKEWREYYVKEKKENPDKNKKRKIKKKVVDKIDKLDDSDVNNDEFPNNEKEMDFVVRVQLTCGNNKTDTYYTKWKDKIWFVKGPYVNTEKIEKFIEFQKYKKEMGLPFVKSKMVMMVPDLGKTVPLGIRNKLDISIQHPFLVCESLIENIQTKIHPGSKKWSPTEIADTTEIELNEKKLENETLMLDYLNAIAFRIKHNIGDCADRNFIVYKERLYSVDEEQIKAKVSLERNVKKNRRKLIFEKFHKMKTKMHPDLAPFIQTMVSLIPQ